MLRLIGVIELAISLAGCGLAARKQRQEEIAAARAAMERGSRIAIHNTRKGSKQCVAKEQMRCSGGFSHAALRTLALFAVTAMVARLILLSDLQLAMEVARSKVFAPYGTKSAPEVRPTVT
jgi:hypothetical protein